MPRQFGDDAKAVAKRDRRIAELLASPMTISEIARATQVAGVTVRRKLAAIETVRVAAGLGFLRDPARPGRLRAR